jgi:hypothetical protein
VILPVFVQKQISVIWHAVDGFVDSLNHAFL